MKKKPIGMQMKKHAAAFIFPLSYPQLDFAVG